jgi:hypothetical protein
MKKTRFRRGAHPGVTPDLHEPVLLVLEEGPLNGPLNGE